jgi:hypothetical protein
LSANDLPNDAPATRLFPQFSDQLYQMISFEVQDLTDAQLDFESEQWEWSKWSIRRNLSHMASGDFRWFWTRWGEELFPDGLANSGEIEALLDSPYDRRLDESKFWALDDILGTLRKGLDFAWSVLSSETVGSMRSREIESGDSELWSELRQANYTGIRLKPNHPGRIYISLEATFRHRYFEHITHLYNIQRLKRAQGLAPVADIPMEGYLALPTWDLSQP